MVPGHHFFLRRFELPAGMAAGEVPGFVALRLEELSPFPLDQLYHGFVRAGDGSAVFAYAAYKRRFPAEQAEAWNAAEFVFPDFLPAVRLLPERAAMVWLRAPGTLALLRFESGRELPVWAASRPLAADAPAEAAEAAAARLSAQAGPHDGAEIALELTGPPRQTGKTIEWRLAAERAPKETTIAVPVAECWAMDVRDTEFVERQRRRLGFDLILWRALQGAAAVMALLVLGEALLFGARIYDGWLRDRTTAQAPLVAALQDKDAVAGRLGEFSRSGARPFEMFTVVGRLLPAGMLFVQATVEGGVRLQFDATTSNTADITVFEKALRSVPSIAAVEVEKPVARPEGTTFSATIDFQPEAFAPASRTPPKP
jgi:hypothetical protein